MPDITRLGDRKYRQDWYDRIIFGGGLNNSPLNNVYLKFINNSLNITANYNDTATRKRRYR